MPSFDPDPLAWLRKQSFKTGAIPPSSGDQPPSGFIFLSDNDDAILTDDDGAYLMEVI